MLLWPDWGWPSKGGSLLCPLLIHLPCPLQRLGQHHPTTQLGPPLLNRERTATATDIPQTLMTFGPQGSWDSQIKEAKMKKSDLINRIGERFPELSHGDAAASVNLIIGAMHSALAKQQRVEIRGFGSFYVTNRAPRAGRNPKTGKKVHIPEKRVPRFRAGKELRERVVR